MYRVRTPGYRKRNPEMRWALPDRVFFACGACHILAYAFLDRYGADDTTATWFKPAPGFAGHHVVVAGPGWVFDYHGFSSRDRFLAHTFRTARRWWPGWDATLLTLPREVLISEARSRTYEGLWLQEPTQFLYDALPRAHAFLDRLIARTSDMPSSSIALAPDAGGTAP